MIRLSRQGQAVLRGYRCLRISNPLAAFAAIMLFASTRIAAPVGAGTADADFAAGPGSDPAGYTTVDYVAPVPAGFAPTDPEAPSPSLESDGAASRPGTSRGLNLSLFLLRR